MFNYCARGLLFYLQLTDYDKQFIRGVWPLFLISHRSSECNQKFELTRWTDYRSPARLRLMDMIQLNWSYSKRNYSEGLRDSGNGDGHRQSRVAVRYDFFLRFVRKGKVEAPCFSLVVLVCRNRSYTVDICWWWRQSALRLLKKRRHRWNVSGPRRVLIVSNFNRVKRSSRRDRRRIEVMSDVELEFM